MYSIKQFVLFSCMYSCHVSHVYLIITYVLWKSYNHINNDLLKLNKCAIIENIRGLYIIIIL